MVKCGGLLKTAPVPFALVAIALVTATASGPTGEKAAPCCTTVDRNEISEPIVKYWIQKANPPCVNAVIFQTETELLCKYLKAPWVYNKIRELRKAKAHSTTASPNSTLSVITSTTSPSPSSSSPSTSLPPSSSSSPSSSPTSSSSPSSSSTSSSSPSSSSTSSSSFTSSSSTFSSSSSPSSSSTSSSSSSSTAPPSPSSSTAETSESPSE